MSERKWKMEIYSKLKTEDVFSNINIFQITGGDQMTYLHSLNLIMKIAPTLE